MPLTRRLRRRVGAGVRHAVVRKRRDGGEGECHALEEGRGGGRSEAVLRRAGEGKGGRRGGKGGGEGVLQAGFGRGNMRRI